MSFCTETILFPTTSFRLICFLFRSQKITNAVTLQGPCPLLPPLELSPPGQVLDRAPPVCLGKSVRVPSIGCSPPGREHRGTLQTRAQRTA